MSANGNGHGGPPVQLAKYAPTEVAEPEPKEPARQESPRPDPGPVAVAVPVPTDDEGEQERLRTIAARAAARMAYQTLRGHGVLAGRAYSAATHGALREQIRLAYADKDGEALLTFQNELDRARASRRQRIKDLPETIRAASMAGLVAIGGLAGIILVLGFAVAATRPAGWTWGEYWHFWAVVVDVVTTIAVLALQAAVWGAGPAWLYATHQAGRLPAGAEPTWALAPGQEHGEGNTVVDPAGIAEALAHLGIPKLNKAIKDGWRPEFTLHPVRVNGRGYQTTLSLPMGVTPDMIADKDRRKILARNLYRHPMEVWPAAAKQAGYLELWVADAGSADRKAPEYPLLHSGVGDYFSGIPLGVSQRGDEISPPLFEANMVFGGQMGMGKSNAARVVILGSALDPLVEIWVYVLANNGDFDAYAPRLSRYERGVDNDVVYAAADSLEELYHEVGRREARLAELGAKKLTRRIAEKHPDMRPIVVLYSECHEMFGHDKPRDDDGYDDEEGGGSKKKGPTVGELATDYATRTIRRARKVGITLLFDTQSSRKDAIPPKVVELVKLNACFYVKSWRSNDGFLGDGSFQAGIRATELRPDRDRGTSLLTGATPERFEILHWYFIPIDDDAGWDAAADVIARTAPAENRMIEAKADEPARDALADIAAVIGSEERTLTRVVLTRLAELDRRAYEKWTFQDLAAALADYKIRARKSSEMYVYAEDVCRALAERDEAEDTEAWEGGETPWS